MSRRKREFGHTFGGRPLFLGIVTEPVVGEDGLVAPVFLFLLPLGRPRPRLMGVTLVAMARYTTRKSQMLGKAWGGEGAIRRHDCIPVFMSGWTASSSLWSLSAGLSWWSFEDEDIGGGICGGQISVRVTEGEGTDDGKRMKCKSHPDFSFIRSSNLFNLRFNMDQYTFIVRILFRRCSHNQSYIIPERTTLGSATLHKILLIKSPEMILFITF